MPVRALAIASIIQRGRGTPRLALAIFLARAGSLARRSDLDVRPTSGDDPPRANALIVYWREGESMCCRIRFVAVSGLLVTAPLLAGCLNLGGRTTYVQENADTLGRLGVLESRVGALEQSYIRATAADAPTPDATAKYSQP